jgi:hypothetical protein
VREVAEQVRIASWAEVYAHDKDRVPGADRAAQLKQWRQQGGGRGKRVSAALWRQAAVVSQADGAYKTARATQLNYDRLRALLANSEAAGTDGPARSEAPKSHEQAPSAAQFVPVQMKPVTPTLSLTIELIRESGERMRIESAGALDLAGVVQAFWRRS